MSRAAKGTSSAAGIVESATSSERVIPQSRRADGSIRKERKVKPGFVPAEDVQRFVPSRVRQARAAEKGRSEPVVGISSAVAKDEVECEAAAERVNEKEYDSVPKPLSVGAVTPSRVSDAKMSWRKRPEKAAKEKVVRNEVPDSWDDESETTTSKEKETSVEDVVDQIASLQLKNGRKEK